MVKFTVPGKPQGKARPRFNTYTGRTYTQSKTGAYEKLIALCFKQAGGKKLTGAVAIKIECFYQIAKSHTKAAKALMESGEIQATIKPDLDNVAKAVLDGLNGLAFDDDKQVVKLEVSKRYDHEARVEVEVKENEEC